MTETLRRLYEEVVLPLSRRADAHPPPPNPTHRARVDNPYCGDRLDVALVVEDGILKAGGFSARGCAVCLAASVAIFECANGSVTQDLLGRAAALRALVGDLGAGSIESVHGSLAGFAAMRASPERRGCATLVCSALEQALAPLT